MVSWSKFSLSGFKKSSITGINTKVKIIGEKVLHPCLLKAKYTPKGSIKTNKYFNLFMAHV
jgi:hypothetical protein